MPPGATARLARRARLPAALPPLGGGPGPGARAREHPDHDPRGDAARTTGGPRCCSTFTRSSPAASRRGGGPADPSRPARWSPTRAPACSMRWSDTAGSPRGALRHREPLRPSPPRPAGRLRWGNAGHRVRAKGKRRVPGVGGLVREQLPDAEFRMIGALRPRAPSGRGPRASWSQARARGCVVGTITDTFAELREWDLLVLPSAASPSAWCCIEAMAMRRPPVASRIDGARGDRDGPDTGILVDVDDRARLRGRDPGAGAGPDAPARDGRGRASPGGERASRSSTRPSGCTRPTSRRRRAGLGHRQAALGGGAEAPSSGGRGARQSGTAAGELALQHDQRQPGHRVERAHIGPGRALVPARRDQEAARSTDTASPISPMRTSRASPSKATTAYQQTPSPA